MPTLVMNQSAANELIDQYSSIIDNFLQGENSYLSIDSIIFKLKEEKEKAEELALQAYHLLGYDGNNLKSIESQINKRIQELQAITHCFNGVDLEKCFISSLENIPVFNYDDQKDFEKFLKVIEQKSIQEVQNQESNFINDMYQELRPYIAKKLKKSGFNKVKISNSGMVYSSEKGYKVGTFNKTLALCGKNIRVGFTEWLNENKEKLRSIKFKNTDNIKDDSLEMEYTFEGEEGTSLAMSFMKMTKEKRENFFATHPGLREQVIITFKEKIIRQCNVPSQYEPMLRNAVNRVSGLKAGSLDAFFGKTTASGLTGILGEIQGLFYINVLLNENNSDATSKWIGGLNNPHADLLLREACDNYGIQVKNTASYLGAKKEIEFRSFGVSGWKDNERTMTYISKHDGFFNFNNSEEALRDMQAIGLPYDLSEAVQNFLLMKTFNVEYEWQDGKAVQGPNGKFHRTRVTIESYADRCQKVMSAFITSLLYMQVANISVAGGEANTLYLIAGELIVSAATIISNLIDELDGELRSFRMSMKTSSSSDINSQYTIVDVINKDYNDKLKKGSGISVRNLHFGFQSSFTFAY